MNRADQTISYYKNGIELGTAFQHVMEERLYPCVGMQTQDEEVRSRVSLPVCNNESMACLVLPAKQLVELCFSCVCRSWQTLGTDPSRQMWKR